MAMERANLIRTAVLIGGAVLGIALLFVVFTFLTPEIGVFRDPLTGTYGI